MDYQFDWDVVSANIGPLLDGLVLTLKVAVTGMVIALVMGLVVAVMRTSPLRLYSVPARLYTELMRGVPIFVMLFWVYYGLASKAGITFSPFQAAAIALGLTGSGYMTEVYRSGLLAIDIGQREGAQAIGLRGSQAFSSVILPQAVRVILPPTVNVFVGLLKGATIVSIIGVSDMIYVAQKVSLRTVTPFELYTVAGLILIAVTVAVAGFAWLLERQLSKGSVHA